MSDAGNWCLIESDPGVFTEMLQGFGVKGLQVDELYSLEHHETTLAKPVYGLVFLFKWRPGDEPCGVPSNNGNIFFAQQVIQNACATQAIINMLMNIDDPEVELGSILKEYKEFALDFDPATRGECLSNSDKIRTVHNSFARPTLYELDIKGGKSEDNYHFVTYIPIGNKVYELDGLREAPIEVAEIEEDWMDAVTPAIQKRIQKYSEGEIHFNLLAVVPNRKQKLEEMLKSCQEANVNHDLDDQVHELNIEIAREDRRIQQYQKENARRRHNYLPFVVELLKVLAKEGKLIPLFDKAINQAKERAGQKALLDLKRKQ
ncbi:unnamed protein product [Caenorhabditis angaria]|uniref:Ubiquitin carboxyl-terminal hydrolase n=1 Tax=Caenorhabditis angaria TaxID=860376 RepID=A0A9P1MWN2_9PELO|nr:unnamed protein product [Caenorhabditis angaria]